MTADCSERRFSRGRGGCRVDPPGCDSPNSWSGEEGEEEEEGAEMVSGPSSASQQQGQDLPSPDTPQGCKEAFTKLTAMIQGLRGDGLEPEVLISNLEYVQEVLGVLAQKAE